MSVDILGQASDSTKEYFQIPQIELKELLGVTDSAVDKRSGTHPCKGIKKESGISWVQGRKLEQFLDSDIHWSDSGLHSTILKGFGRPCIAFEASPCSGFDLWCDALSDASGGSRIRPLLRSSKLR